MVLAVAEQSSTPLQHAELSEAVIGAAFEVHNQLGYGFLSPQYDRRDEAQLLNELKATGMKVGPLLNFGRSKLEFKRLIF